MIIFIKKNINYRGSRNISYTYNIHYLNRKLLEILINTTYWLRDLMVIKNYFTISKI